VLINLLKGDFVEEVDARLRNAALLPLLRAIGRSIDAIVV
jgi:hypothetical protein